MGRYFRTSSSAAALRASVGESVLTGPGMTAQKETPAAVGDAGRVHDGEVDRRQKQSGHEVKKLVTEKVRVGDYRVYFERHELGLVVHRILNRHTLKDFLFRSGLKMDEDEALQQNPKFWEMIEMAKTAAKA